jgi:glycosyltransferase involved in cell wall biosynthesis
MSSAPRVAIGVPMYNGVEHVEEALESLLAQSHRDFVLACVDDCSTDGTAELARRYSCLDDRVAVRCNTRRLGMVGNWCASFQLAREVAPGLRYFAWASDHDVWHREWLGRLVAELDASPEAVLAYPLNIGISPTGETVRQPWSFDTAGERHMWPRLRKTVTGMSAGNMVYGLFRAEALARCGVYRRVIVPDRLLLSEVALYGEFRQVEEVLWRRRYRPGVKVTARRQRKSLFPGRAPPYAYLPWPIMHTGALGWSLVVRGRGRPRYGRAKAAAIVLWYAARSSALAVYRKARTAGHRVKAVLKTYRRRRKQRARSAQATR